MKLSIIIPTYNSLQTKLFLTLDSILNQTVKDYEIIISDDGSKEFDKKSLVEYFNNNNFQNYQIIIHNENIGTVKNIQSAYRSSKAEYVYAFGPGDLLYARTTLEYFFKYLEKEKPLFGFSRFQSYHIDNQMIVYDDFQSPPERVIYSYLNNQKALKYMVLYNTYCCGASLFFNTKLITQDKYLINDAIYCEDLIQVLLANDSVPISFYDNIFLFYEYGSGISTNSSTYKLLQKDHISFYSNLCKSNKKQIFKRKLFLNKISTMNFICRKIFRVIFSFDFYIFLFLNNIKKQKTKKKTFPFNNSNSFWNQTL